MAYLVDVLKCENTIIHSFIMFVLQNTPLKAIVFLKFLSLFVLLALCACSSSVNLPGGKPRKGKCDCRSWVYVEKKIPNG